jgi:hypothetical protein
MRLLGFLHEEDGVHSSVWYTVLLDSTCLELRRFQNLCSDDCRNDETAQLAYWKDLYSGAVLSCCTMFFKLGYGHKAVRVHVGKDGESAEQSRRM